MEKDKKIASALITIEKNSSHISMVNNILSEYASEIIARQGLSIPYKSFNIITLVLESEVNTINSLAGKIGKIPGANIKILINKLN
jgi:putative iron-only hydrogenase system regulator